MTDNPFVRVKDTVTGHQYSVRESAVDPDRHEVIDKPALDASGDPAPAKPNLRASTRRSAPSQPSKASEPTTTTEEK